LKLPKKENLENIYKADAECAVRIAINCDQKLLDAFRLNLIIYRFKDGSVILFIKRKELESARAAG